MKYHLLLVLKVVILIISLCEAITTNAVIRETNYGRIRGFRSISSQNFLGIPFASPPKRWEAPRRPSHWNGTLHATKVKPMCYQAENCADVNPVGTCLNEVSENCLYLNIFAPLDTNIWSKKAVMLFIHGGGFEFSSGGADVYNGEVLSSKGDVIVVTFNYRLGAFGFLVTGDGNNDITGNYGILDQIQALQWVHENIGAFGGDNNRITLFGQSAGALSIVIHMTSAVVAPLFQRVIIESSPFTIPLKPLNIAINQGKVFSGLLNCPARDVVCLKSKSANEIASAQGIYFQQALFSDSYLRKFLPWIPHIDGRSIKQEVMKAFVSGTYAPKPAIIGSTSEEGQMYIYLGFGKPMSILEYRILLFGVRPKKSSQVYKMYKPEVNTDSRSSLAELTTDFVFYCPARTVARSISNFAPVYSYVFNNNISMPSVWNQLTHCIGKVCHGVEIPFVFQSARKEPWVFSQNEFLLSDSMVYYWTNFAKTGNPNNFQLYRALGPIAGPQIWLPYKQQGYYSEIAMVLNENGNYLSQGHRSDKCNTWDQGEYKARK